MKKNHNFQKKIWDFYNQNKRNFPWRQTSNPYHILVSEIMLQQTQTSRVVEKYNTFLHEVPTIKDLALLSIPKLLSLWQGLGYNRRALYLQRSAQEIVTKWNGTIPQNPNELVTLPGIGPNTAASIIVFSYNIPFVFIETNIRRVYIHEFFSDQIDIYDKQILPLIEQTLDHKDPRNWYYALMDYGAHLPKLVSNPNRKSKHYAKQSKFEGSLRQVRGKILKQLLINKMRKTELERSINTTPEYFQMALDQLEKEGFIQISKQTISLTE